MLRQAPSYGTSFLDLLSSALACVLLVYVTAPEEPQAVSEITILRFELPGGSKSLSLVGCVVVKGVSHCSTDAANRVVEWEMPPRGQDANWLAAVARSRKIDRFEVAIRDDHGVLDSSSIQTLRVTREDMPAGAEIVTLTAKQQFHASGGPL